jgi:hypothetical protein
MQIWKYQAFGTNAITRNTDYTVTDALLTGESASSFICWRDNLAAYSSTDSEFTSK